MKYICIDDENNSGSVVGTLEEAFDSYRTDIGNDCETSELIFYEVTRIEVKHIIVQKTTPVKAISPKSKETKQNTL